MESNARFRTNVRMFYAWVGSLIVFAVAPFLSVRLIDYGTTLSRAAAVAVGVGATLAMLVRADFIPPPDLMVVLLGCFVVWFLAIMGAKLHFERSR